MANVYVDPVNGVDDESTTLGGGSELRGSEDYPYQSIAYAYKTTRTPATVLTVGSTLYVMEGTHRFDFAMNMNDTSNVPEPSQESERITIKAYSTHEPVIQADQFNIDSLHYYTFEGLTFDPGGYVERYAFNIGDTTEATNLKIHNCTFRNFSGGGSEPIHLERADEVEIINCHFENVRPRKAGGDLALISILTDVTNVLVKNCTFIDCGTDCSRLGSGGSGRGNIVFDNNVAIINDPFVFRDAYGEYMDAPTYQQVVCDASDVVFDSFNRLITSTTTDLSGFEKGSSLTVTNTANNNDLFHVRADSFTNLIALGAGEAITNETATACTLTSYSGAQLAENFIDVKGPNPLTGGCVIKNNYASGYRATITNGDSSGANGPAITLHVDSDNVEVHNNVIENCTRGIVCTNDSPQASYDINIYNNLILEGSPVTALTAYSGEVRGLDVGNVDDVNIYNNTLHYTNETCLVLRTNDTTATIYNNIFYGNGSATTDHGTGDAPTIDYNSWYGVTTHDTSHIGTNDISTDPLLDSDHRPTRFSPCIDAGVKPLAMRDYHGAYLAKNAYDIGALWFDAHEDSTYIEPQEVYSNSGRTTVLTYPLPKAIKGVELEFYRDNAAHPLRLDPKDSDYFAGSSAGEYKSLDTDSGYVKVKCLESGVWSITYSYGSVSDEVAQYIAPQGGTLLGLSSLPSQERIKSVYYTALRGNFKRY